MDRICQNCQIELGAEDKFCGKCGTIVPPEPPTTASSGDQQAPPTGSGWVLFLAMIIVLSVSIYCGSLARDATASALYSNANSELNLIIGIVVASLVAALVAGVMWVVGRRLGAWLRLVRVQTLIMAAIFGSVVYKLLYNATWGGMWKEVFFLHPELQSVIIADIATVSAVVAVAIVLFFKQYRKDTGR